MNRKLASVQKIREIKPIEGADRIEVATVLGWKCVVPKDQFKVGDSIVYFEIDSLIPYAEWSKFLWKDKVVEDTATARHRLKTVKLRKQISQGLVQPLNILNYTGKYHDVSEGADLTEALGITKYEPAMPSITQGIQRSRTRNFPSFLRKTDEIRVQSIPKIFDEIRGKEVYISEKIDGTSATYYIKDGKFGVCSRNLELFEEKVKLGFFRKLWNKIFKIKPKELPQKTVYWQMAKDLHLEEILSKYDNVAIQGEIAGEGIQKNPLKLTERRLFLFNLYFIDQGAYANFDTLKTFCENHKLEMVPIIKEDHIVREDWNVETLVEMAKGKSLITPSAKREGIVIRTTTETYSDVLDDRMSFKAINNDYLLSGGE